jgi:nuclear pore complex protein Nup98-Nup96
LFGQPAATTLGQTTGGLFGGGSQTQTQFGQQQAPATQPLFGPKPMFSQSQQALGQSQPVLHASLDKNPYGINPLLQKSTNETNKPSTPRERKLPTLNPSFKVTPRSSAQIKLRGVAPVSQGPSLSESHRVGRKTLHVLDGSPRDVIALGLDNRFTPRRSVKRLVIGDASQLLLTPSRPEVKFDPGLEEAYTTNISKSSPSPPKPSPKRGDSSKKDESNIEYTMSPSLDVLLRMSDDELRHFQGFKISIPIYGSVEFLESIDLLSHEGRKGIQTIPDNIVCIEPQLITVYPDESLKPPVGFGLNVPAIISLRGCWPKDKATGVIIDNENDPRFDKHIRKLKAMPDTVFLGFEVITGTWKFRVEHF